MKKHSILVVNSSGGLGGDVAMVLAGLPALIESGYRIHAASIPQGPVFEQLQATPQVRLYPLYMGGSDLHPRRYNPAPLRALESAAAVTRLSALVWREAIDAIYTFDRTASMPVAYAVSLLTGRPLIYNAQISFYLAQSRLHRTVVRHATRISVSSEQMRARFVPYVRDPQRLVTIPNAITVANYRLDCSGETFRREMGFDSTTPLILLAGRLQEWKGQADLLRAAPAVLEQHPNSYFLFAGSDYGTGYQAELEHLARSLGIYERVRFLGFRSDLASIIAAANLSTMPSHEEPFGLVALEAMAMGKPVVATSAGGVPEFLIDGEMGYLIAPHNPQQLADRIIKVLNDPERAGHMGRAGRQQVERGYDTALYGQRIVALFDSVFDNSARQYGLV